MQTEIDKEKPKQQTFQMEWRQCPGCPQEFKVLTTSKQIYHSLACENHNGGKATKPVKKKKPWESLAVDQKRHGEGVKRVEAPTLPAYSPPRSAPLDLQIETVNSRETAIPVTSEPSNEQKEPQTLLSPLPPALPETLPPVPLPAALPPSIFEPAVAEQQVTEKTEEPSTLVVNSTEEAAAGVEQRWQSYIDRGKVLVSKMGKDRLEIATIAIEACDILRGGGGHWRDFEGIYTMKRFSEEVGISYKTLANWVRVKRNVYDKLIALGEEIDPALDWGAMNRVADRCAVELTPDQVLKKFNQNSSRKGPFNPEKYFLQGLRRIRSLNHFLTHHKPKKKTFADEDLKELKALCKSIGKWLDT